MCRGNPTPGWQSTELQRQKQQLVTEKRELTARVVELQEEQDSTGGGASLRQLMAGGDHSAPLHDTS